MAQKTEKEDAEFKYVPETLTPCINNCGLTGNPSTNNMCLNCFTNAAASSSSSISTSAPSNYRKEAKTIPKMMNLDSDYETRMKTRPETQEVNRCSGCRKKVGLTGFRCRCGALFCLIHRYSDRHNCSYDYKAAGKAAIARANPVVKAAKIVRI